MRKTGAQLVVYALEQLGIRHTFGIPGVHNTELYDCLDESKQITPVLVTHEQGAAFMADAIGRSSERLGCLVVVPAAGITHAMSGIGEAFLDGVPMLVISGGVRRDTGRSYQLHQLDQEKLTAAVVKKYYLIQRHEDIVPTLFAAHALATSGEPGPVMVELPFEVLSFTEDVGQLPRYTPVRPALPSVDLERAASLLRNAKRPVIFAGWGARNATKQLIELAERLDAPVSTTLQGLSVFPADHPLHAGMGFGTATTPAARLSFEDHDCMLAVGTRFSELATGSYCGAVAQSLIHVDINPDVFDKNFKAEVQLCGDAPQVLTVLLEALGPSRPARSESRAAAVIAEEKRKYRESWRTPRKEGCVNPARFFESLRRNASRDAYMVVDDGNHTFLAAEHFPVYASGHFISPTDFNCMGYAIPAAVGLKFNEPDAQVLTVVGDGAFLMTGLELLTAASHELGLAAFVFRDGELGQISQFQKLALGKKTCTELPPYRVDGIASAVGADYLLLSDDERIDAVVGQSLTLARKKKRVVVVEVIVDYSRKSSITKGVARVNFSRFSTREKLRFAGRSLARRVGQGVRSIG